MAVNEFASFGGGYGRGFGGGYGSNTSSYTVNHASLGTAGNKSVFSSSFASAKSNAQAGNYVVGQQVSHKTFGKGMILKVTPMGPDSMLEIAFDDVGTKKIMANFAKLTVI